MRLAIAASVVTLGACASLGNLTGGSADAGSDAVAPPSDDAGVDATDAGGSFCASHAGATLCDDFDEANASTFAKWTTAVQNGAGSLSIGTAVWSSPPQSLLAQLRADTTSALQIARLLTDLPPTSLHTRVSFALQMAAPTLANDNRLSVGELLCLDGTVSKYDGAWLMWYGNGVSTTLSLFTDYGNTRTPLVVASTSPWVRLELDAFWGNASHVVVRADGAMLADVTMPRSCPGLATFQFVVGLSWLDNVTTPFTGSYDDVLVEVDPP